MSAIRLESLLVACAAIGCSVINSFDDVVQSVDAGTGGTGNVASGGDAGTGGATGGSSGQGGSSGDAGTGAGGGSGGASGGGAGGTAGGDSGPTQDGLIVMYGGNLTAPQKHFLVTINPWTGAELTRAEQTRPILALAYEALRNKWYVFIQGPSGPDPATLKAGEFDAAGAFVTQGEIQVPAPLANNRIAVLKDRLFYRSAVRPAAGGAPTNGVTVLNTAQLNPMTLVGQPQTPLPTGDFVGFLARPNTAAAGGTITLVQKILGECAFEDVDAGTGPELCPVKLLNADVASGDPSYNQPTTVGFFPKIGGNIAWAIDKVDDGNLIVFPPKDFQASPAGKVELLNSFLHSVQKSVPFQVRGPHIADAAFDNCRSIVLATELNTERAIFAIPLTAGGTIATQPLATSGTRVLYEPFTRTVIRPFDDQASPALSAFVVKGTATAPTFEVRGPGNLPWSPPTDLRPFNVQVKDPLAAPCN